MSLVTGLLIRRNTKNIQHTIRYTELSPERESLPLWKTIGNGLIVKSPDVA